MPTANRPTPVPQNAQPRKPYVQPRLVEHGTVGNLTRHQPTPIGTPASGLGGVFEEF